MTPLTESLTSIEQRALKALREHGPCVSTFIALQLWPDSEGWRRSSGRGAQGLARAAARVLYSLKRSGHARTLYGRGYKHWQATQVPDTGSP